MQERSKADRRSCAPISRWRGASLLRRGAQAIGSLAIVALSWADDSIRTAASPGSRINQTVQRLPPVQESLPRRLPSLSAIPGQPADQEMLTAAERLRHERFARLPPVESRASTNPLAAEQVETPVSFDLVDRTPWWQAELSQPLRPGTQPFVTNLNDLIISALRSSPRVQAIREQPLIRETAILEASAEFDPMSFLESKYVSSSDPVGNTLTTGGPSRFLQQDYGLTAGFRKKGAYGGALELSQRVGRLHNNSIFLVPPYQGNAKLSLSYTQPMLRGGGSAYNSSLIVLAELDADIAADQAVAQLQDHLLEVTRAYEALQLHRAVLIQQRKLTHRAESILAELEARQHIDAMHSQIARTRAAVTTRRAQLIRAATEVQNAETRIQALVQSPALMSAQSLEIVPVVPERIQPIDVMLTDAFVTALQYRPEVGEAINRTRSAEVRAGMARNEVLPSLDLVLETYIAGLAPDSQIGNAFSDQFTEGQPGFTAGFVFESPWGSRAAKARLERRELEFRQLMNQFRDTLATIRAEVEIAVREVETARREMEGYWQAMQAAELDIRIMEERWRLLPGDDGTRSILLEDILRAQERATAAEFEFAQAQLRYSVSIAELKRATGTLFQHERLNSIALPVTND